MTFKATEQPIAAVATIGVFDGVHLGHQALLRRVVDRASALGVMPVCVTFHPHPEEVLRPEKEMVHLCSLEDRIALIEAMGISRVLLLEFTIEMSRLSPEQFIEQLEEQFGLRELWVGSDFALGKDRAGNHDRLAAIGKDKDFLVYSFPPVEVGGEVVSSSRIRRVLAEGDVVAACRLMGRPYRLRGTVVSGDKRGRTLGFPTANVSMSEKLAVPGDGVYAVRAVAEDGVMRPAVASIGVRPTFDGEERLVEVYLMDFQGELYGRKLSVDFVSRLRGQERFDSVDGLVAQMRQDVDVARATLEKAASC